MMEKKYGVSSILGMEIVVTELAEEYAFLLNRSIFEEITGTRVWDRCRIRKEMAQREFHRKAVEGRTKFNERCYHDFHPSI